MTKLQIVPLSLGLSIPNLEYMHMNEEFTSMKNRFINSFVSREIEISRKICVLLASVKLYLVKVVDDR